MIEKKDDGGPAFPEAIAISPTGGVYPGFGGMSLRDYFAGQALTGAALDDWGDPSAAAKWAYAVADAMIAARAK